MEKNKSNKTIYVNKYDYMHYYTRCEDVWFLSNKEILSVIQKRNKEFNTTNMNVDDKNSYKEFEEEQDLNINNENKENELNEICNDKNKKENELDKDPKLIEGQIIDKQARDYIKSLFNVNVVIDYDDENYNTIHYKNNLAAQKTKQDIEELIKENKTFMMFQPTFICKTLDGCDCVTKCDCIIYLGKDQCYLIEVKGSSSTKSIYLLDLLFQKYVIDNSKVDLHITNYKLCLIAYTHAIKGVIPFVISDYINLTKGGRKLDDKEKKELREHENEILDNAKNSQEIKENLSEIQKSFCDENELHKTGANNEWNITATLNAIFKKSSEEDILKNLAKVGKNPKDATKLAKKYFKNYQEYYKLIDDFPNKIAYILEKKKQFYNIACLLPKLCPCSNCTSKYRDCDYWLKCQGLFSVNYANKQKEFFPYIYSGNVFSTETKLQMYQDIKRNKIDKNNLSFLREKVKEKKYLDLFIDKDVSIDKPSLDFLKNKLSQKSKRVYFDFESIDPAIVPVTGIIPLNHVVTQNSIIKTDNYFEINNPVNMLWDPKNVDINWIDWFKSIVDNLYEEGSDTWYIVYNKSFEANRLHEMDMLIAEPAYHKKIKSICDNIFDLVDFFNNTQFSDKNDKIAILPKELHGYYTIKKVINDLIPEKIIESVGCTRYNDPKLSAIHKGDAAKDATMLRYLSSFADKELITNEEWNETCDALKKYCENDVRAMIAVEKFIKYKYIDKTLK